MKIDKPPGPAPSRCGSTQNMAANIKVVVRVRPLNDKERELNNRVVVDVVDETTLVFDPKEDQTPFFYQGVQQPSKNYLKRANKELQFSFDHVCCMNAANNNVFEITTKDMLLSLMEGYNCSVFVYGATGAGKTFTMIGNSAHPGITYLTMEHLFNIINSHENEREFDIAVSYIEVYNENVYDLLNPSKTPLQLREDSKYGVMVAGLTLSSIKTARQLLNLLENGNMSRTQHPTDANAESSRSHAVFQVYVKMRYKVSGQHQIVKLSMIDLAGSERAAATGCVGDRFKEGANINRSLLSLGNCINRLADGSNYIPYRDSKLTRLLKDSLGGNCKTVMIANISPSSLAYEDTYNTLKYAARANKIQLSIKKNYVNEDMSLSKFVKIKEELLKKIKELEAKLSMANAKQVVKEDPSKVKAKQECRNRITQEEATMIIVEKEVLALMIRQRVLSLRHRLRTQAFSQVADLGHRGSTEETEQMHNEDMPRQERNTENYIKQSINLESKIQSTWAKWDECQKKLNKLCAQAVIQYPDLSDFVTVVKQQSEIRQSNAKNELQYKLLQILNESLSRTTECTTQTLGMLKNLYFTLKGYDKHTPSLTAEYTELLKKVKSAKSITWYDKDYECDPLFKFVTNMNLISPQISFDDEVKDGNVTVEIMTDSEDLTDKENQPLIHSAKKRKGTPIKLCNNETILINDSFESLDTTRNLNSAKKVKREFDVALDEQNCHPLDPKDLNSTFVLAGKVDLLKKPKLEVVPEPVKRGVTDRTNYLNNRAVNFADKGKIVIPLVGKAVPFRRPPLAVVSRKAGGFGSTVSRDGTPLQRNTDLGRSKDKLHGTQHSVAFKAMRPRARPQNLPYTIALPNAARNRRIKNEQEESR